MPYFETTCRIYTYTHTHVCIMYVCYACIDIYTKTNTGFTCTHDTAHDAHAHAYIHKHIYTYIIDNTFNTAINIFFNAFYLIIVVELF